MSAMVVVLLALGLYVAVASVALLWAIPRLRANDEAFPVWPGNLPGEEQGQP